MLKFIVPICHTGSTRSTIVPPTTSELGSPSSSSVPTVIVVALFPFSLVSLNLSAGINIDTIPLYVYPSFKLFSSTLGFACRFATTNVYFIVFPSSNVSGVKLFPATFILTGSPSTANTGFVVNASAESVSGL